MNSALTKLITFRSKQLMVVHETCFSIGIKDAWNICNDYSAFISLMLCKQSVNPSPEWLLGGPGELGAELRFTIQRDGKTHVIVERVVRLDIDEATGTHTLAWEQLSSKPKLPVRNYGCTWVLVPDESHENTPRCRLTWTRYFDEPMLLGLVSLASIATTSLKRSAEPIINDVFPSFYEVVE
ncbi:hypothetical protein [uncultured Shewanella sp.]|uniref:hypothetical protein n=1 Tax=uncultured Shewanella sp. TaxID=173975 RepID=UPI00262D06C8|nr:hypothetical protein [uncultured Shewanella sp.]